MDLNAPATQGAHTPRELLVNYRRSFSMSFCRACGSQLAIGVRFCSTCGTAAGSDDVATLASDDTPTLEFAASASPRSPRPASSSSSRPPSSSAYATTSEGRFLPGRLIAGRYRIIALLGKGGMGEVYRADD